MSVYNMTTCQYNMTVLIGYSFNKTFNNYYLTHITLLLYICLNQSQKSFKPLNKILTK